MSDFHILETSPILLVDDKLENLRLLEVILHSSGFSNTLSCQDGDAGLEALSEYRPHLVILDLEMPRTDGYTFLLRAKQIIPEDSFVPILVLTADGSSKAKIRALELGASDFLTKPCDVMEVRLRVANFLRIRSLNMALKKNQEELELRVRERTEELEILNQELLIARDEAQLASSVKSRFLANMNHELRTPMNSVIGFTSLLLAKGFDSETVRTLNNIDASATTLLRVIDDVLELSEFEGSPISHQLAPCDLGEIVQIVLARHQESANAKGIKLQQIFLGEAMPKVLADGFRLDRILNDLVSNAVKFTHEGSVTLSWSGTFEGDLNLASFVVEDSGIGIPAAMLSQIFLSFTQAEDSANRRYGGIGLGLTLTKKHVEAMGGTISVVSEVGVGTTFTVQIPFDFMPVESKLGGLSSTDEIDKPGRQMQVLVAEDNEINLMLIQALLERCDCAVSVATNGIEAIEMTLEHSFDLVLMDIQMPMCDGLEATTAIRRREALEGAEPVPIYAVTANATAKDREACLKVGMMDLVPKPVKIETVRTLINDVRTRRCW